MAYLAAEDADGCRARIEYWRRKRGRTDAPTPFQLIEPGVDLLDTEQVADLSRTLSDIADSFGKDGADLGILVIDTLAQCVPGADENSSTHMSQALQSLEQLARDHKLLVVVVAHFGKSGGEKGIRGWSGLGFNADGVISVEVTSNNSEVSVLTFTKVKNGPSGGRVSFRVEYGVLRRDEDGDEVTSGVVVYEGLGVARSRPKKSKPLTPAEDLVMGFLRALTDADGSVTCPPLEGVKPHHRAVTKEALRKRSFLGGFAEDTEKRNTRNVRFNRTLESLAGKEKLRVCEEVVWLI